MISAYIRYLAKSRGLSLTGQENNMDVLIKLAANSKGGNQNEIITALREISANFSLDLRTINQQAGTNLQALA